MNIVLLGAAGFIGTNLTIQLAKNEDDHITLIDVSRLYFKIIEDMKFPNVSIKESGFGLETDFNLLVAGQDIVYHLVSTTVPTTSNKKIPDELMANVVMTSKLLEACVSNKVSKVIFISSGGTVYGKEENCPLKENMDTYPISSYGLQKVAIEKLLYLYYYMYGLDYRVVRLANPYGPYQRPNGILGAVTTFTYKALMGETISVYGDGSVIRDFIYVDDAIRAILKIASGENTYRTFNLGCGYGTSIKSVINTIHQTLQINIHAEYLPGRAVDVPVNYLDISRYEEVYGNLNPISLSVGIQKTAEFIRKSYKTVY